MRNLDEAPDPDDAADAELPPDVSDEVRNPDSDPSPEDAPLNEEWPTDDLEAAYRRALEANDAVEWEFDHFPVPTLDDGETDDGETDEAGSEDGDSRGDSSDATEGQVESDSTNIQPGIDVPARITARQVIEAALFVGGQPLTTKKLAYLLRGEYELDAIEDTIDELNLQYVHEMRPYEIRLGKGGFRLVLREDFERVRNRVYGVGPREVKLSQDVLEVLALVAYRQPISPKQVEELGKDRPGGSLRQLLRRELIAIQRDPGDRKNVRYVTTPRFLSLFGLGSLEELPQADELAFK